MEEDVVVYRTGDFLVARSNPECGFTFLLCRPEEDIRLSELTNKYLQKTVTWLRDGSREAMRGIYVADQVGTVQMGAIIGKASLALTNTEGTFFLGESELSQILAMVQKDGEVEELIEAGRPLSYGTEGYTAEGGITAEGMVVQAQSPLQQMPIHGDPTSGGGSTPGRKRRRPPLELPEGWTEMHKVRQDGSSKGRRDVYYVSPDKKVFRSRASALKYMRGEQPGNPSEGRKNEEEDATKSSSAGEAGAPADSEGDGSETPSKKPRRAYRCTVCGEIKKGHRCKGKPSPLPAGIDGLPTATPPSIAYGGYPSLTATPPVSMGGLPSFDLDPSQLHLFAPLLGDQLQTHDTLQPQQVGDAVITDELPLDLNQDLGEAI